MTHQLSPAQVAAVVAQNRELKAENEALKGRTVPGNQADYDLPADVLARAAEAVHNASVFAGCDCDICKGEALSAVRAALPVLAPALRAEAIRDARLYLLDRWRHGEPINEDLFGEFVTDAQFGGAIRPVDMAFTANEWLTKMEEAERKHIPAAEERESEGAR